MQQHAMWYLQDGHQPSLRLSSTHWPSMMQVLSLSSNIRHLKHIRLYVVCPLCLHSFHVYPSFSESGYKPGIVDNTVHGEILPCGMWM